MATAALKKNNAKDESREEVLGSEVVTLNEPTHSFSTRLRAPLFRVNELTIERTACTAGGRSGQNRLFASTHWKVFGRRDSR